MNVNKINYNDNIIDFVCNRLHHFTRRLCESLLYSFYFSQHPPLKKEVLKYMSEVMISRRGGSGGGGNGKLITEYITFNLNWTVPEGVKNNEFSIRIFGAGGDTGWSRETGSGGAGGWMNNDIFTNLTNGQSISISVGKPGLSTGGTTSFGTYLSAFGGSDLDGGSGGGGWDRGGIGYQFGGGCPGNTGRATIQTWYAQRFNGGNGGVWGGGGASWGTSINSTNQFHGGNGGTYGGGGGCHYTGMGNNYTTTLIAVGGNGGTYGGGGGGGGIRVQNSDTVRLWWMNHSNISGGRGGTYGGNGGNGIIIHISGGIFNNLSRKYAYPGNNGINTSTWANVTKDDTTGEYFRGSGLGYIVPSSTWYIDSKWGEVVNALICGGGGGGYGGNGGNSHVGGGGGGGYGGNGGNSNGFIGGGGGGYGGDGGNGGGGGYGKVSKGNLAGGGYYCPAGGKNGTGGGGGIGIWNGTEFLASFGSGGIWWNCAATDLNGIKLAEPGICIIQYYV